ncbi:MAG TPA: hypothetical protein VJA25_15590 [Dehalococcoidia bacterium]|nr:hypothetical protein [Dehalococcoidia bacterium]
MKLKGWDNIGVLLIDSPNNNAIDQRFMYVVRPSETSRRFSE